MIERKSEIKQGAAAAVLSAAVLAGSLYINQALDYRDSFIPGTVINGVEAAGHTVAEMKEILGEYGLEVKFRDGEGLSVSAEDIDYHYVDDGSLDAILAQQNPYLWGKGLIRSNTHEISEKKEYSKEKLLKMLDAMPQMNVNAMIAPQDAYLGYVDGVFTVIPEVEGTTLDPELVRNTVLTAVNKEIGSVDLENTEGVYSHPEVRKEDEDLNEEAEQLNELAGGRVVYQLPGGRTKVLDGPILKDWLEVDDEGDYYRDDDVWDSCITDYVKELADEVDTVYKEHTFTTHDGDEIKVPGKGYYGYRIEKKKEEEQLWEELDENEQVEREPVYRRTEAAEPDDNHGFGSSYVEVDLSKQHLWIYENGEVVLETDVVSGLNDKEHRTPAGAYFAYDKKRDTVLRGDKQDDGEWGYETPVDYWIRLTDTGIGLHDANWRYSFGGNIWKWNGSHGCVNIPPKVMPTIYELVYENMPVVVHYGDTQ